MIFVAEREVFASALKAVLGRAKNALKIPILHNVLITADGNKVSLCAHDLDSSSEAEFAAEVETAGSCAVPAAALDQLLAASPKGATIKVKLDGQQLHVLFGRSRYRLPVLPATDFPPPLAPEGKTYNTTLTEAEAKALFERPLPMVPREDQRTYLMGVFLHAEDGRLSAAATDAKRLVRVQTAKLAGDGPPSIIVPRFAAVEIVKLVAGGVAEVVWSQNVLSVSVPGRRFATKLVAGEFPDYHKFTPADKGRPYIEVDRIDLLDALSRLAIIAEVGSRIGIEWEVPGNRISLYLRGEGDGTETLECEGHNVDAPGLLGVPPGQLNDLLEAMTCESVRIIIGEPMAPFRIVDPNEPSLIAVQVPCSPIRAPEQKQAA